MISFSRRFACLGILAVTPCVVAQIDLLPIKSHPKLDAEVQNKKDALAAFKNGDQVNGLAKLNGNITRNAKARKEEIQLNSQLIEISYWLANEQHARTKETALLAIEKADKSRNKLSRDEEAAALAAIGQLYEQIVGDPIKARGNYAAALALDNREPIATKGLARLNALAATIADKATENDAMRQRALNPPR
jgi:hypothetical protein